jgi:protein SCO1/2
MPVGVVALALALAGAGGMARTGMWSASAVAAVTIGGPFTLVAPDGTTVTEATYRGKWLLIFFGYTFCPDTCPTTLSQFAVALGELGADAAKVQALFVTVDPERDTPEVMGQYAAAFDPRIVGLTGSAQQIATVSREYGVSVERHPTGPGAADYLVDHSTYIYIMDPEGRFVRGLDADTPGGEIAKALRNAMAKSGS